MGIFFKCFFISKAFYFFSGTSFQGTIQNLHFPASQCYRTYIKYLQGLFHATKLLWMLKSDELPSSYAKATDCIEEKVPRDLFIFQVHKLLHRMFTPWRATWNPDSLDSQVAKKVTLSARNTLHYCSSFLWTILSYAPSR